MNASDTTHDSRNEVTTILARFGQLEPLQEHFLARLIRLTQQRDAAVRTQSPDGSAVKLLAKALYATYLDCVTVGVGDQAQSLLDPAAPPANAAIHE